MKSQVIKSIALISGALLLLTACDPPMPPEVKAALAEQSYTCVEGETKLSAPDSVLSVAGDWKDSVETNCPGMQITPVAKAESDAEMQVNFVSSKTCEAYATVPFAVDAVVIAVMLTDITSVNLSANALAQIWSGKIARWNDPVLVELNPDFSMPDEAIGFGNELDANAAAPLNQWLTRLAGSKIELARGTAKLKSLKEGQLVVTNYSDAMAASVAMVGIVAKPGDYGVIPEVGSINSGASMFQAKTSGGQVALTFNPKAKPIAPEGVDVAPAPYQAISVLSLSLCGIDSLKTRAAARYLLRQDSQGSLGLSTIAGLPENLRIIALSEVSKGLPEPVVTEPTE